MVVKANKIPQVGSAFPHNLSHKKIKDPKGCENSTSNQDDFPKKLNSIFSSPTTTIISNAEKPSLVESIAAVLTEICDENAGAFEIPAASKAENAIFFATAKQNFDIAFYLQRIKDYTKVSESAWVVALIYLSRIFKSQQADFERVCLRARKQREKQQIDNKSNNKLDEDQAEPTSSDVSSDDHQAIADTKLLPLVVTHYSVHRMILTALLLAHKYLDDRTHENKYWARVGGVEAVEEMNKLEARMLNILNFRLSVDVQTFNMFLEQLHCQELVDFVL